MLRKEEVNENALPDREAEVEEYWFDGPTALGDVRITRTQALKLAGLGGAGFLLTLVLPDTADARKRRRRRRRRRAKVTPVVVVPGATTPLTITNLSADKPLTIKGFKVLDSDGRTIDTTVLGAPVTIQPGDTAIVPVTVDGGLVDADKLRLIDDTGTPITVVDENGVTVGDIDIA